MNSETDFVARNKKFQGLASAIALSALDLPAASASVNLLSQAQVSVEGQSGNVKDQLDVLAQVVGEKVSDWTGRCTCICSFVCMRAWFFMCACVFCACACV